MSVAVILTALMQMGQLVIAVAVGAPVLAFVRRALRDDV